MNEVIEKIISNENIEEIYRYVKSELFLEGPKSIALLEILTYLNLYAPEYFDNVKEEILEMMGVFYKEAQPNTLHSSLFGIYEQYIKEKFKNNYTPVQANIIKNINNYKNFSFSAPTSTGKSYVFRNLIEETENDVVIIVPSRALINEYYDRICNIITDKTVNVLTFVDIINTKYLKRSIFILTPERAKELFKFKKNLAVELFLFDEAQLSDEDSVRGLYFDSIVRRIQKTFPNTKCIFAHPFISNPDAQLIKNHFIKKESVSVQYRQKNVGQIFYAHENEEFYHFGIEKELMGKQKIKCEFDPLIDALNRQRSILIYTTKASIYNKTVFKKFEKYLNICELHTDTEALRLIEQVNFYIGSIDAYYHSEMIEMLKRGIVTHHGSLPLQARLILEHFTQKGFCRICFATSTLEQGINMPFDVVYLNTFEASKTLSMKNLIGRAGRSTNELKFDYGSVVIKKENMSGFRKIMLSDEILKEVSLLDIDDGDEDVDYKEFKEAINSGEFSDEFNLTNSEVQRLNQESIDVIVISILNSMFSDEQLISLDIIDKDLECRLSLYNSFNRLYRFYMNGRQLSDGEESVLSTAIKILIWKVHCKTFKEICWRRYSFAASVSERKRLAHEYREAKSEYERQFIKRTASNIDARFIRGYDDLPNINLQNYSIYPKGTKARDVDYDRIVFDTYDYLDKLIGFKLTDVFYAVFYQYYEKTMDIRALKLSKYFKYGTDNDREILLLRYGLSFEDIDRLDKYIINVSQEEIIFDPDIKELSEEELLSVKRYI